MKRGVLVLIVLLGVAGGLHAGQTDGKSKEKPLKPETPKSADVFPLLALPRGVMDYVLEGMSYNDLLVVRAVCKALLVRADAALKNKGRELVVKFDNVLHPKPKTPSSSDRKTTEVGGREVDREQLKKIVSTLKTHPMYGGLEVFPGLISGRGIRGENWYSLTEFGFSRDDVRRITFAPKSWTRVHDVFFYYFDFTPSLENPFRHLSILRLSGCPIGDETIANILNSSEELSELWLSGISKSSLKGVSIYLKRKSLKLKVFVVAGMVVDGLRLRDILEKSPELHTFVNRLDKDMHDGTRVQGSVTSRKTLRLLLEKAGKEGRYDASFYRSDGEAVLGALATLKKLRMLVLYPCVMTSEGTDLLGTVIKNNPGLKYLGLSGLNESIRGKVLEWTKALKQRPEIVFGSIAGS